MSLRLAQIPTRSANIFINYRREDSAGHAGRLFDGLSSRFPGRVFMDIDTIEPGIDFVESITQAVRCCEVLIVVIGREWLHLTDASGHRRLDNPNDFVRLEIAAALERNIRIIPVLVEDAAMPKPEELSSDLLKLTRRNAIALSDARWAFDVDRLIQAIEGVLQEKAPSALFPVVRPPSQPTPVRKRTRPLAWLAVSVLVLLPLVGWIEWRRTNQMRQETAPAKPPQESQVISEPPPEPAASPEEKTVEVKTSRPPKTAAAPPPETLQEDSAPSKRRLTSLVRKAKGLLKKARQG
jgi:hypothetical protein